MALVPANAAAPIASAYRQKANLTQDGQPLDTAPVSTDYPAAFADSYDTYAAAGEVPGSTNTGGTKAAIANCLADQATLGVDTLAQALADYWATVALTPGTPAHGGSSVESVTNDAATRVAAFKDAITTSITAAESTPWFEQFIANVEAAAKQIQWTVTEMVNGTPTPFIEHIA